MKKIHPRKRFGQHFLRDESVLDKICHHLQTLNADVTVEIGPGTGALTAYLLRQTNHLIAIEIDRDLVTFLTEKFAQTHLNLVQQDVLKADIATLLKQFFPDVQNSQAVVVGNLPYNISTPLIFNLLSQLSVIKTMVFMVQKEVADRLTAVAGQKNYGRLSIMTGRLIQTTHLFDVSADAFEPPPKVQSSVIRMTPREHVEYIKDENLFASIVSTAFSQRRKTIRNAMKNTISDDIFHRLEIDSNLRAENLNISQYIQLANSLDKNQ